jgi:hypothetical protein
VTIQGGADLPTLQYLKVTAGSATVYTIDGQQTLGTSADGTYTAAGDLSVGEVFIGDGLVSSTTQTRVIVVGHFSDGQEQMLIDRSL